MGERYRIRILQMKLEGINDPEASVIEQHTNEQLGTETKVRAGNVYEFELETDNIKKTNKEFVREWVDKFGGVDILYQYDSSYSKVPSRKKVYKANRK